jgi:hypothetical protein
MQLAVTAQILCLVLSHRQVAVEVVRREERVGRQEDQVGVLPTILRLAVQEQLGRVTTAAHLSLVSEIRGVAAAQVPLVQLGLQTSVATVVLVQTRQYRGRP